jgi:hypothetical protein
VTSKIFLTAAVFLFALSGAAVAAPAHPTHARSHLTAAQAARQSFNWVVVPSSANEAGAPHYHGGPKSND